MGAGTITCNYDGANKSRTVIGDGAFIGSGNMLVAPVTIGENATTAAGSTITQDAPPGKLTLARAQAGHHRRLAAPGQARPQEGVTDTCVASSERSPGGTSCPC